MYLVSLDIGSPCHVELEGQEMNADFFFSPSFFLLRNRDTAFRSSIIEWTECVGLSGLVCIATSVITLRKIEDYIYTPAKVTS